LTAQANRWSSENRAMLASAMSSRDRGRAVLKTQEVGGRVIDQNGEPLGFVSVALLSADSTYIQGATSDENGAFMIQTTDACCILRLSFIGYRTQYVDVKGTNVGTIQMEEDLPLLNEIIVKGQMPKTKLTGNSMVTTIQGTILGTSGTAKEMLAKVPGMTLKGDELEVLGKGTPIFYINGRKMHDKEELKRLRSEEIASVEVITNPGAQYDATISSVVRIKTIRREGDGFGFDVNTGLNQDLRFGESDPSAQLNLRYRHNNLDLFGMVNYWKWDQTSLYYDDQSNYLPTDKGVLNIVQNSHSRNHFKNNGIDYNLGFNWQIAENHSVGVRIQRNDRFNATTDLMVETDIERQPLQKKEHNYSTQDEHRHTFYNWEGNAYYNGKVGKMGIDLNVDFLTDKTNVDNHINELVNHTDHNAMEQDNSTFTALWATKLVLTYPIWKGQLEAGTELSFVTRENSSSITNYPLPTSDSKVKENNIAAFVAYNFNLEKVGNFSAGLRYEHVGFDYTDHLDAANNMTRYQDEFFPSLSWARQFGPVQTSVAYSFKTIRPDYNSLSDRITYINSYTLLQGDPTLKNATMQEVSLNARYKWLNLFAAYERRDNTLTQLPCAYNNEGMIMIKRVNLADPVRNLAVFLSANPTFGIWSPNWTVGGQKFWNTMEFDDPRSETGKVKETYTKPIFFIDLNNTFRLPHRWQLEANMNIMTKGDVINFRMQSASYNLGFVVQKYWLKNDALCLRASINDVLQRSTQTIHMDCGGYQMTENAVRSNHRLNISLRYTFNASKSKYKGTGAGQAERQRMSSN
ncbi:MAG: TonB-dependent receptor, partial [Prevotella sp.]|nr:TonB-dependent receptor [Prevotella sp.]